MRKNKRIPIDELLDYWIDISKRPILTLEDYELFFERITESMKYFEEFYGGRSPPEKFLERMNYMWFYRDNAFTALSTFHCRVY